MKNKILSFLSYYSTKHPLIMLGIIFLLTSYFVFLSSYIELDAGYAGFLPDDDPKSKEFNRIIDQFENDSNIILLASGENDDLINFADEVNSVLLDREEWIDAIAYKVPNKFLEKYYLSIIKPDVFKQIKDMYSNPELLSFLTNFNSSIDNQLYEGSLVNESLQERSFIQYLDGMESFIDIQRNAIISGKVNKSIGYDAASSILFGNSYMMSYDRNKLIMILEPAFNLTQQKINGVSTQNFITDCINGIEKIANDIGARHNVNIGLTGTIVLQRDELAAVMEDSMMLSVIALISIMILLVVSFKMLLGPMIAILSVLIGLVWAFGMGTFFVEKLSPISAMMSVVMIGLGIDYCIHIMTGYAEEKNSGHSIKKSIYNAMMKFGPGIITGSITTSAAFGTMVFSKNDAMTEAGLLAAQGILTMMVACLLTMPTMIVLKEKISNRIIKAKFKNKNVRFISLGRIAQLCSNPKTLLITTLLTAMFFYKGSQLTVDYNIMNLEPEGLKSVSLQDSLIKHFNLSSEFIMITTNDLSEAKIITKQAQEMETAGFVESIADFIPTHDQSRKIYANTIALKKQFKSYKGEKADFNNYKNYIEELKKLEGHLFEMQALTSFNDMEMSYNKISRLVSDNDSTKGKLTILIDELNSQKYNEYVLFNQSFSRSMDRILTGLVQTNDPLTVDALPDDIKKRFIGKDGKTYLITIYPNQNVYEDLEFMIDFSRESEEVSKKATGLPIIMLSLMDMMVEDGKQGTLLALLAVLIILFFDFGSLSYAVIAMVPVFFGMIWMSGLMQFFNMQLNMMNIMTIPLIIGIGIDDGVHAMHRYKLCGDIDEVFASTGKAILLTSLTTMLGFGSLAFATMRGLGSMGLSLFLGTAACFITTLLIIPPIIRLFKIK